MSGEKLSSIVDEWLGKLVLTGSFGYCCGVKEWFLVSFSYSGEENSLSRLNVDDESVLSGHTGK